MRRLSARRAIALTSASVGRRNVSRSVSRMQRPASRNAVGRISCNICKGSLSDHSWNVAALVIDRRATEKGRPVSRLPLEPLSAPPVQQDPAESFMIHRLFGRLRHRNHRYESAAAGFRTKLDTAFNFREESMVRAHADIKAGMPGRAALTRNHVAGNHVLAAIGLDAKALACGIAAVT